VGRVNSFKIDFRLTASQGLSRLASEGRTRV
jgi:hypothetical protein